MPELMERVCEEVIDSEPGTFNWAVMKEPTPEPEDDMETLDALLNSWVPAEPPAPKDKGKGKEKVKPEVVKAEASLETGKTRVRSRGQKRKAEVSGEEEKESKVNAEDGTSSRGKKARIQVGGSSAGPSPADGDDDEYDFAAIGRTVTPAVPRPPRLCDQCIKRGDDCKFEMGVRGQACDTCRSKKSACSFVQKGPMNLNRLTSNPPSKEKESMSRTGVSSSDPKVKPAKATPKSKPQAVAKAKAKPAEASGSSKAVPQDAYILVPDATTTVYANPKFSGPNPIEEKSTGETVLGGEGQRAVVRVTRATQKKSDRGESSQGGDTREGSVRPGHDGETPRT